MSPDERPELYGFAHLPYPLIVLNETKDVVVANPAVQQLFAPSTCQLLSSNLSELPVDVISKLEWASLDDAIDSTVKHHFKGSQIPLEDADSTPKNETPPAKDPLENDPSWMNPDGTDSCDITVSILKSNSKETDLVVRVTIIPWAFENLRYTTLAFVTLRNENGLQGFGSRTSFSYLDRLPNSKKPPMAADAAIIDGLEMASGPRRHGSRDLSSSGGQNQLDIEFSHFRDAIYWNSQQAGFILSADEKFCFPNYRGSKSVEPVEVDDVAMFFGSWDVWDSTFEHKLPLSQYPSIWLNRNRKNFHRRRYGLVEPNGRKVILEADGNCLYDQENGAFIGGVVWLREIGVHPEFNLKESQDKLKSFETICDSMPHLVWTTNQEGECDYLSRGWYEYTGTTKGDSFSVKWDKYIHCDDRSDALQQFGDRITQNSEFELEFRYRRHDGKFRWMVLRARPLLDSKDVILKWYGTLSDIHTRVNLERENKRLISEEQLAQQRERVRTEFLAHMSHEIRTPIAGVVGMADLLNDDVLDEEQTELVNCIRISSKLLLTVVNDILDFSRIESGKLIVEEVPFIVSEVVNDACQMVKSAAQKKVIDFGYTLNIPDLLWTKGDPTRLAQILSNLLTNSVKFTPSGSVHLTVSMEDVNGTSSMVFIVQDTGIGIDEQVQRRLFEPFSQGDASTARLYGGTGLGLIISRNLAHLLKGTLELESTPSVGTKATLTLPFHEYSKGGEDFVALDERGTALLDNFKDVTENPPLQLVDDVQEPPPVLSATDSPQLPIRNEPSEPCSKDKINLLIVEDNDINQKIAIKSVRKLGFSTTAVWNGQEALDHLYSAETPFSAILMDIQMPILDGYETTRKLRTEEKFLQIERLRNVPIIALTASAIQGDREKCLAVGMNDYLSKPYSLKDLEAVISKWVC